MATHAAKDRRVPVTTDVSLIDELKTTKVAWDKALELNSNVKAEKSKTKLLSLSSNVKAEKSKTKLLSLSMFFRRCIRPSGCTRDEL